MPQNTIQPVAAQAVTQYVQNQRADESRGVFSSLLEAAVNGVEQSPLAAASPTTAKSGASWAQALVPLMLTGVSQEEDTAGLLPLLMLALVSGSDKSQGLSSLGTLFGGADGMGALGGLLGTASMLMGGGMSGGLGGVGLGTAAMQASMVAAQSLLKAYQKPAESAGFQSSAATAGSIGQAAKKLFSNVQNRSAELYRAVIDQFNVEQNPRYAVNRKGKGDTYCNVFVLDVTEAMGAPIPRRINADTGEPAGEYSGNVLSMNANRMTDWLNTHGAKYGWYEVTAEQAQALANRGCPVVAVWKNTQGGHGHVQVVSPSKDGTYNPERGVAIAQAGRILSNYTYIRNIYSSRLKEVQYFAHR